ncbi:MAG: hypothetical protein MRY57_01670 [Candidatus Pacebacteria bacterium]|nr:hypothetical protein [Candidatus Paceibacterota bacterium]
MKKLLTCVVLGLAILLISSDVFYASNIGIALTEINSEPKISELTVFSAINQERIARGVEPLRSFENNSVCLEGFRTNRIKALENHIIDHGMSAYYNHDNFSDDVSEFRSCNEMMKPLRKIAENTITIPYNSTLNPVELWMQSETHKHNILERDYDYTTVIVSYNDELKEILIIQIFYQT